MYVIVRVCLLLPCNHPAWLYATLTPDSNSFVLFIIQIMIDKMKLSKGKGEVKAADKTLKITVEKTVAITVTTTSCTR